MSEKHYISENAQLMAEWDWEKNDELKLYPQTLTLGSGKKAWWKCSKGHEYQAMIYDRNNGKGCPYCAGKKVLKCYNDLQTVNPSLAEDWSYKKNGNLKPEDFTPNSGKKVWWRCSQGHEWQATIHDRNGGKGCPYCSGRFAIKGYNDLQTINPLLAKEWNCEKNGNSKPENFTANSGIKVWWKCNKGHEWQASIHNRNKGEGCPVCNSERSASFPEYAIVYYLKKYGLDVLHSYREKGYELDVYIPSKRIAIEYDGYLWHKNKAKKDLEKNKKSVKDGIKLYRIREGLPSLDDSSIDYVVQRNQEDLSKILELLLSEIAETNVDIDLKRDNIVIENFREHTEKETSLLLSNPEIVKEWNYEKNGNLKPEHFAANSNKRVWWKCSKGHEWQAGIATRNKGHKCPYCSGIKTIKGTNDLQTVNPILAKEWNYEKNQGLTPADVMANSGIKVWWRCNLGHEWQATISNRNYGTGCPACYKAQKGQRQINMYDADTSAFIATFDSVKAVCDYLGLDSKKANGTISRVCRRKQKTLMKKYVLRNADDDEFSK